MEAAEKIGEALKGLIKTPKIRIECANQRMIATGYTVEDGLALHLVNLKDTICEQPGLAGHEDVLVNFTDQGEAVPEIILTVAKPQGKSYTKAILLTPERQEEVEISCEDCGGLLYVTVPGGLFSGYALVAVEE